MTRPGLPGIPRPSPELLLRLGLCVLAVLVCYRLDWSWLSFITSEAVLRFVGWLGFAVERLSPRQIAWNGQRFEFGIACTFADVFCGALPLLWLRSAGVWRNAADIAAFAAGLFAFNLLRQATAALLFAAGAPWALTDAVIGGLGYFVVWTFLVRRLERDAAAPSRTSRTAATPSAVAP